MRFQKIKKKILIKKDLIRELKYCVSNLKKLKKCLNELYYQEKFDIKNKPIHSLAAEMLFGLIENSFKLIKNSYYSGVFDRILHDQDKELEILSQDVISIIERSLYLRNEVFHFEKYFSEFEKICIEEYRKKWFIDLQMMTHNVSVDAYLGIQTKCTKPGDKISDYITPLRFENIEKLISLLNRVRDRLKF